MYNPWKVNGGVIARQGTGIGQDEPAGKHNGVRGAKKIPKSEVGTK